MKKESIRYFRNDFDPQKPIYSVNYQTGRWELVSSSGCAQGGCAGKLRKGKQSFHVASGFSEVHPVKGQYLEVRRA